LSDDPNDISQFTSTIAGNFFGVIQYNKDNRAFEVCLYVVCFTNKIITSG